MSLSSLDLDSKYIDSSIAELLRRRYEEGECFHQLGAKCFIAVNPLHLLLRSPQAFSAEDDCLLLQRFLRKAPQDSLPKCHKYGFAGSIHATIAGEQSSQTVVFRGCSGSGKSELLKSVVQYLICADSKKKDVVQRSTGSLFPLGSAQNVFNIPSDGSRIGRVLSAGLLMYDTMGTIITPKNDHSTRTMKHLKLVYGHNGLLQGVRLVSLFTDLLRFSKEELCDSPARMLLLVAAGLSDSRADEFRLHASLQKAFLESSLGMSYYGAVEELSAEFVHVELTLLQSGALTTDEWTDCLKAFSACIHLLSVSIKQGTEVAEITAATKPSITSAEELLGLQRGVLTSLITQREDTRIGKSSTGALIDNRPAEAVVMLESLCRIIYGRTFKHCLYQCSVKSFVRNRQSIGVGGGGGEFMAAVAGGADSRAELHLVDMPGWVTQFEAGQGAASSGMGMVGHLQHLLQNYMEERVHEEYLQAVFQQELQVYRSEGVSLDDVLQLPSSDESQPFKEFFERPVTGLISLLEEACQAIKPDDRSLVSKILVTHLKTKLIKAGGARANPTVFVIHHSFGDVNYDLDGFIVQNKHFYLQAAVLTAIESSAVSFIAHDSTQQGSDAGPPTAPSLPNGSTAKPNLLMTKTASLSNLLMTKSRDSLQKLLFTLTQHKMNYALCISTAPICKRVEKQAALFNKEHVVAQCRYYALSSRIALGQKGYPHIQQYRWCYDRYRPMLPFHLLAADLPISVQSAEDCLGDSLYLDGGALQRMCELLMAECTPYLLADPALGQALTAADAPKYGSSCIFLKDKLHACLEQYRSNYMRDSFVAAVTIRACYLRFRESSTYRRARRGVVLLQSKLRSSSCRSTFLRLRHCMNRLKATYRMRAYRSTYVILKSAVQVIKNKLLGRMAARLHFKRLQRSLVVMRGLLRGCIVRHTAISTFSAMQRLQRAAKRFIMRIRRQRMALHAAHCIQRCLRGHQCRSKYRFIAKVLAIRRDQRIARRVVTRLQARWRRQLVCMRFREVQRATLKLQTWWRGKLHVKRYNKMRQLVLWLQSIARRVGAQNLSSSISAKIMVQQELELLNEGLQREMSSIKSVSEAHRLLGSGYTRNESSKFDRLLLLFDLSFDLSFAYPGGWLRPIVDFCRGLREERKGSVRKVAVGSQHTVLLDDLSNVYSMGLGDLGQLGHNNRLSYPQPRKIENLSQHLSSSAGVAAPALHKLNANHHHHQSSPSSSSSLSLSRSLSLSPVEVKDVCCGKDHSLLLTSVGTVYSWGDNRRGQLGHSRYESSAVPRLVGTSSGASSTLHGPSKGKGGTAAVPHKQQLKYVRSICCGDYHSVCLADPGTVYTWGSGQCLGRLSLDAPPPAPPMKQQLSSSARSKGGSSSRVPTDNSLSLNDSCEPDPLPFFSAGRHRVQQICSGENHVIARSGSELFAWGLNQHGQLGDGSTTDRLQPVLVHLPLNLTLTNELELLHAEIVSGGRHNVLLYKGQIWSWGWNKYGQVGDDSAEDALRPHSVQLSRSPSPRQQQYVRSVTAGLRHTIVLTASQQLFGWGLLHLTNSSSSSCGSEVQQQQQGSVQSPPVSFIPKNISHCVPSLTGHALSPGGSSDNLFLALTGSSSSSLSFVALDMCSSSREGGGNNQSRRAVGGRRSEKKQITRAPSISRSISKSPVRRGTGPDTTAAPLAAAVTAARRKDATQKQQQFNTVLYKVDKPAANASQNEEIIEKFKRIKSGGKTIIDNISPVTTVDQPTIVELLERNRSRSVSPMAAARTAVGQKATHKVTWKPSTQVTCAAARPLFGSSLGGSPSTAGTTGKGVTISSSSLVDLFSPKLLSSCKAKATRSSVDGDYNGVTSGSTIRETFVVLSGPLNIASIQEQSPATARDRRPSRHRYAPSSLGVGMPKTERAFLAAYAAAKTGGGSSSPSKRKQSVSLLSPSGGQAADNEAAARTDLDHHHRATVAPMESKFPSFMSPTLSYYSKLAARRTSVDDATDSSIIASNSTFRRPSSFTNPSSSSSAGPVRLPTPIKSPDNVDPAEFLGLDSAIEKLRAALDSKQLMS